MSLLGSLAKGARNALKGFATSSLGIPAGTVNNFSASLSTRRPSALPMAYAPGGGAFGLSDDIEGEMTPVRALPGAGVITRGLKTLKRRMPAVGADGRPLRRKRRAKGITGTQLKSFVRVTKLLNKYCKVAPPTRRRHAGGSRFGRTCR
jgi:hypothetical protein